jgi:uncharacterized low-complexity protein
MQFGANFMKKTNLKPVAAALGTALAMSVAATPAAADANPFGMTDLNSGYQVAWGDKPEGKCGEGKCGEDKKKTEAKCGEGKCGGDKKKTESKCGEGKCGAK